MKGKFIATVKVGPKGQIVIPKEVRDMFGVKSGDLLVLLADADRGIALQCSEQLNDIINSIAEGAYNDGAESKKSE